MRFRPSFVKRSQTVAEDGQNHEVKAEDEANGIAGQGEGTRNGSSARQQPKRAATSPALQQLHQSDTVQRSSKKKTMQDFFRSLRPTGRVPAKAQPDRRSRVAKSRAPSSKRNSRLGIQHDSSQAQRSFDISDDVLDRLMGPPKSLMKNGGRDSIQSDQFFMKQRLKASSRNASSGPTQAQKDRRLLSAEEVEQLTNGMPYYSVVGKRPGVAVKGADDISGEDWRKHGHETFGLRTLAGTKSPRHGAQEVPNMLSASGLDPGTVGFEYFLQLPVSDSNALPDEPDCFERRRLLVDEPEQLGLREISVEALIDRLVELDHLRVLQHQDGEDGRMIVNEKRIEEMGEDLFRRLVDAELGISAAGTGSVTLQTQVTALQTVLNEEEVWYNFSQPVWRMRVGEILWSGQDELLQPEDDQRLCDRDLLLLQITLAAELLVRLDAMDAIAEKQDAPTEDRETMSLKVQWDLVLAQRFLDNLAVSADVQGANKTTSRASLFSANSFFTAKTNANSSDVQPVFWPKSPEKQLDGLAHFAKSLCWPHAREIRERLQASLSVQESERNKELQVPGKRASGMSGLSVYATPLSSPTFPPEMPDLPPQYARFATSSTDLSDAPAKQKARVLPATSSVTTNWRVQLQAPESLTEGDDGFKHLRWLSRSWLSGLVLPGESADHLLLSTMLENSPDALQVLGDVAHLHGGFQYAGYSYWSKQNVLGRILAPSKGARECMGWIAVSSAIMAEDGWIRLEVRDAPSMHVIRARIQNPEAVAKEGDPLCGSDVGKLQAGDFVAPTDGPPVMGNEVKFYGLAFRERSISGRRLSSATDLTKQLMTAEGSRPGTREESPAPERKKAKTGIAKLSFGSPINSKLAKLELLILYDVHFIASHPCHPQAAAARSRSNSKPLPAARGGGSQEASSPVAGPVDPVLVATDSARASSSTTTQNNTQDKEDRGSSGYTLSLKDIEKELPPPPAHLLHINHSFEVVPVATLLTAYPDARPRAVSRAEERPKTAVAEEVVVLDCRGAEDLEMLARAWCAKVGENALIGRSGRTCLACCVREARALGVCVVIRT